MTSTTPGSLVCVNRQCSVASYPTTRTECAACHQPTRPASAPGVKVSMPPPSYDRAGKVVDGVSRTVFGGFWTLVTLGLLIGGMVMIGHGNMGGLLAVIVAVLTGFYARYIFRGGRFRFLFW